MSDVSERNRVYPYLGRTEDYPEFQIIDSGRIIEKIETWTRGAYGIVRLTTRDGQEGYGQLSPFEPDITATVLHRQVARHVLGSDPSQIDALVDRGIDANMKFPWSYVCRALQPNSIKSLTLKVRVPLPLPVRDAQQSACP